MRIKFDFPFHVTLRPFLSRVWWTGELGLRQGQVKGVVEVRQQAAATKSVPPRRSIRATDLPTDGDGLFFLFRSGLLRLRCRQRWKLIIGLARPRSTRPCRTSGRADDICPLPSRARRAGNGGHHRRKWRRCLRHGKWNRRSEGREGEQLSPPLAHWACCGMSDGEQQGKEGRKVTKKTFLSGRKREGGTRLRRSSFPLQGSSAKAGTAQPNDRQRRYKA